MVCVTTQCKLYSQKCGSTGGYVWLNKTSIRVGKVKFGVICPVRLLVACYGPLGLVDREVHFKVKGLGFDPWLNNGNAILGQGSLKICVFLYLGKLMGTENSCGS